MADHVALPHPAPTHQGISLCGVTKSFGSKRVLDGCDLQVNKGETLVVLGRSGEGKSVLLKHMVRLLEPDAGDIWIDGQEITGLARRKLMLLRRRFGFLFQGAALFDSMTIGKNVGLMLEEHTDWSRQRIRARVRECLEMVGLDNVESKLPSERAIAMEPEYILYDEPTTGLDPITSDAINDLIIMLRKQLGVTGIVVTHDMPSAFKIADRMAMLNKGKIVYTGTVAEVRATDNSMVRQFIKGSSQGPLETF